MRGAPAFLASFLFASVVSADPASEAQLQYELGAEMYRQRRLPEALERFLSSHRLVPNPNVAFNVAQIYALIGRPAEAYNWYEEHLSFRLEEGARDAGQQAQAALAGQVAVVEVATDPPGADVYVDREDLGSVGRAPRRIAVAPGPRRILVRYAGHAPAEASVTAELGRTADLRLRLSRLEGEVHVESDPPGAIVRLEGNEEILGTTPLSTTLPLGALRLVVAAPGRIEQTRALEVRGGETVRVEVELPYAAGTIATLTVRASPANAQVLLGERAQGRAPWTRTGLEPGPLRVTVRAPGHEPWTGRVVLEAGAATRVRATLVRHDSRHWAGWYWLGLGAGAALLAGGAVVGVLALAEHDSFDREPNRDGYDRLGTFNLTADLLGAGGLVVIGTTLVWDWLSGPPLASSAEVKIDR